MLAQSITLMEQLRKFSNHMLFNQYIDVGDKGFLSKKDVNSMKQQDTEPTQQSKYKHHLNTIGD